MTECAIFYDGLHQLRHDRWKGDRSVFMRISSVPFVKYGDNVLKAPLRRNVLHVESKGLKTWSADS